MKRALILIVPLAVLAVVDACSPATPRCLASNCQGCCDLNGQCQRGDERFACGLKATMCASCAMNEICALGTCVVGDGGTGGSGGSGGAGGSGGNTSGCNASNCGGCCDNTGTCRGGNTNTQCGSRGITCGNCPMGQACTYSDAGTFSCQNFVCNGCISTTGNCLLGTSVSACGADAGMCRACLSGQSCVAGQCQTAAGCTATTCAGGCCDGTQCVDPPTALKCGRMGGNCSACSGTQVCSAGTCVTGGTGGGTGGTAGSGGTAGGSSSLCGPSNCPNGCCDPIAGVLCLAGTDNASCGRGGGSCNICIPFVQTCQNQACAF